MLLEDIGGTAVHGYRATSFSITRRNLWALSGWKKPATATAPARIRSSTISTAFPNSPALPSYPFADSKFVEIPVTTMRMFGRNWPAGGGGYFRLLPYALFKRNLQSCRSHEHQPCTFYFHPWEIDPGQPRIAGTSVKTRFRHYLNLDRTYRPAGAAPGDFRWSSIASVHNIDPAPYHDAQHPVSLPPPALSAEQGRQDPLLCPAAAPGTPRRRCIWPALSMMPKISISR